MPKSVDKIKINYRLNLGRWFEPRIKMNAPKVYVMIYVGFWKNSHNS